jgi:ABC-type branched-subunit amino acid transport system substrate-binding protein
MTESVFKLGNTSVLILLLLACQVQAEQLTVGQVAPMSGIDARLGRAYAQGLQICFESTNRAGGVNGHTFFLASKDDQGRPEETIESTRALVAESKPLVLAGYFGNRNLDDLNRSGILEQNKLVIVGYRASAVRGDTPVLYSVRAGMAEEIQKITQHLATIGITRLGLLYEEGPNSSAVLTAANEAAKRAGSVILVQASFVEGSARVRPAVDKIIAATPQAVIMLTTGAAATAGFIELYRDAGGSAQLFALSGSDVEQLSGRLSEEQMQGVVIAQVTPSPYAMTSRLSKEVIDTLSKSKTVDKSAPPPSYTLMEGFIACKVIVEAVRRQGKSVTREGMKTALDSITGLDLGGYVISFSPNSRIGSRFVALSIVTAAGKIRQ